jgi:zinc protease
MRAFLSPLPAATAFLLAPTVLPAAAPEGVTSFTLPNGLVGVVIEDHRAPVATHMVWYRVGGADDPPGRSGLAHFLEHLMFKGTDDLAEGEFSRRVAANGGEENAFTTLDYTAYHQRIAADRLDLVMAMEADRMTGLDPGEAAVLAERDVVAEERREQVGNAPDGPFMERMDATLYLNSPYGRPVIGWDHEIAGFTRDAAMAFYRAHYAPNTAILVVAGDVDPAEVRRLAEARFGPIPASPSVAPRRRPQEPPPLAARRVAMQDARVREPYLVRTYLAPRRRPGAQAEAAALTVLAELLGGSEVTSVMARGLTMGYGIAVDAGADYFGTGVDAQSFGLYVVPKPGVGLAEAEARLDALLARFVAQGPDQAELARLKARMAAAEIYDLDRQQSRARRIGSALATGLTLDDVAAWPGLLQAVTPADVQAAARSVLRPEASVTGWLTAAAP